MKYKDMLFDGKVLAPNVYVDSLNRMCEFIDNLHYLSISEIYNELYCSHTMSDYANFIDFLLLLKLGYFNISYTGFDLDCEVYPIGRKE